MYRMRSALWSSAVAVPTEIIDRYLKLASPASFKVLLFLLRNPNGAGSEEQIARCTGLSESGAADALAFWVENGILEQDGIADPAAEKEAEGHLKTLPTAEKAPAVQSLPVKKPTQREIAQRLVKDPELSLLYNEAQLILGTFGYDTEALILMIRDFYGLPSEVVLMLLQYQKQLSSTSGAAIKWRAEDWAKRGLCTLALAEDEIRALGAIDNCYFAVRASLGLKSEAPSPRISNYLRSWAQLGFSPEMCVLALNENGNSFSLAGKLLEKWQLTGITTPKEAQLSLKKTIQKQPARVYDTTNFGKNSVLERMKKNADREN